MIGGNGRVAIRFAHFLDVSVGRLYTVGIRIATSRGTTVHVRDTLSKGIRGRSTGCSRVF